MRITPDIIHRAPQFTNCLGDREIDLRGYKIPAIENLGSLGADQFSTIDLSHNAIVLLHGFPKFTQVTSLFISHNSLLSISSSFPHSLPYLETLVLNNNRLSTLADLVPLSKLEHLKVLSVLENPVVSVEHYRAYLVYKIPTLRALDWKKVTDEERAQAKSFFKSKKGKELREKIQTDRAVMGEAKGSENHHGLGENMEHQGGYSEQEMAMAKLSLDQKQKIRNAIAAATSLDQVSTLEKLLMAGKIKEIEAWIAKQEEDQMDTGPPGI